MRDIKFRAWDKTYERFVNPDDVFYLEKHGGFDTRMMADEKGLRPILMQYTGLKDKNGVEIFEGDVVRSQTPNYEELTIWFNSYKAQFEGRYEGVDPETGINYKHYMYGEGLTECEVIGNIYENPELLK